MAEVNVPQHVGIIMDANGRWAKKRGLPRKAGHKVGAETFRISRAQPSLKRPSTGRGSLELNV